MIIIFIPYICSLLFDKNLKTMFELRVIGLEEGKHPFEIVVEKVFSSNKEYEFKNVVLQGEVDVLTNKFGIKAKLSASVDLICDRSGNEFTQELSKDLDLVFKFTAKGVELMDDDIDSELYKLNGNKINISDLLIEELFLLVPLKKISPDYQDIEFEKLFPKYADDEQNEKKDSEGSPWNALKKLNFN